MALMNRVSNKVSSGRLPARPSRLAVRVQAVAHPSSRPIRISGGAALLASLVQANPASADVASATASDFDTTVNQLIGAVKATGDVIKTGIQLVGTGVEAVKEGYTTAEPYLKEGYKTVAPVVKQALDLTQEAVTPVIKAATPIVQDSIKSAVDTVGVNVSEVVVPVTKFTQAASAVAAPYVSIIPKLVSAASPVTLGEYALGAFALYLVVPPLLGVLAGSFRGFAGQVSATAALDLLVNGGAVLVDLRTQKEKEAGGVPDLPGSVRDRVQDVEYTYTEDRRLRGLLKDPSAVECQVTALQVAALRRVNKGSTILLLDRYSTNSVGVAKELNARGYSKAFVIAGGFDGRLGWVQSKLQVKPAVVEVSSAPQLPSGSRAGSRKQLPAPR